MNSKALVALVTISLASFGLTCRAGEREVELAMVAALEALTKMVLDLPRTESDAKEATFDPRAGFVGLSREQLLAKLSAARERARDRAWFSLREESDEATVKIGISTKDASFWHTITFRMTSGHVTSVVYSLGFVDAALQKEPNQSLEPTPTAGTSAAEQPLVPAAVVAHL